MKLLLFDMMEESGVELLLHSAFAHAFARDGKVEHVIVENKSGRQAIRPKFVIDCSADADVVARVGAPFVKGREEDGAMQPVTLFYRIGGVNYDELRSWMKSNRDLLKDSPTDEEIDSNRTLAFLGLSELVRKAVDAGEFPAEAAPRIQAWYFCLFWMPGYLQENLNLTLLHAGLIGWMPFLCADLGGVASGVVSDRMVRNGAEPWRARRRVLVGTAALAPLVMLIPFTAQLWVVIFAFCALALVCQVWLFNMTTMVADVFPRHTVASVLGLSGSFGALGGLLSNALIGSFVGTLGFTPVFFLMGCVHLIAAGWIALFIRGTGNPNPEESIQASGV